MNEEYIITESELMERGLNLDDYTLDSVFNTPLINIALDICVTRVSTLDDTIKGEDGLNEYLGQDTGKYSAISKQKAFKKLQYRVIYNLIFTAEESPVDSYVDNIIVFEMGCGKINGFQKGLYYRNN